MHQNITLSAEESLIKAAQKRAHSEHTTLNAAFQNWLEVYAYANSNKDSRLIDYIQP